MTALAIAIGGTAAAEPIAHVAKAIKGTKIKKRSIPGNRIKTDSLTGKEIAEAKLGKVPSAGAADSAMNAAHATNADTATNANDAAKLGGLAPGAFVQGGGNHVLLRKKIPANTPQAKLFALQDAGTMKLGCTASNVILHFINDTGAQQDVATTLFTPTLPHTTVDYSAQYGPGGESSLDYWAMRWTVEAGSDHGQALLELNASFANGNCVVDVQGLSTLALS